MASWDAIPHIQRSELRIGRRLGTGGFAIVYEGTWRGTRVAVKVLTSDASHCTDNYELHAEAASLSDLRHPSIWRLLGAHFHGPRPALDLELMEHGALWNVFRLHRETLTMD